MQSRIAAIVAVTLMAGTAMAQTPSAMPTAKSSRAAAPAEKPAKPPVARTAKSLDCSKQADAKGIHGKPRKSFMSSCKKA